MITITPFQNIKITSVMDKATTDHIKFLADKYETEAFLASDPSQFMHKVSGDANQETMAFIASCLSYGSRKQFFGKIQYLLDASEGNPYEWISSGRWKEALPDTTDCFYRLYTFHDMHTTFCTLASLISEHGSLKAYVNKNASTGIEAVEAICAYFAEHEANAIIPKNAKSACKRICMFLRWMVRDGSPVDLGLWSDIMDRRTLIMPLDTHVVQESLRMGLLKSRTASMGTARRLTDAMLEIFPDDPLKGDFALFGLGVDEER